MTQPPNPEKIIGAQGVNPADFFRPTSGVTFAKKVGGAFAEDYDAWIKHTAGLEEVEDKLKQASVLKLPDILGREVVAVVMSLPNESRQNSVVLASRLMERAAETEKKIEAELEKQKTEGKITPEQVDGLKGYGFVEMARIAANHASSKGAPDAEVVNKTNPIRWGGGVNETEPNVRWDKVFDLMEHSDKISGSEEARKEGVANVLDKLAEAMVPAAVAGATAFGEEVGEAVAKKLSGLKFGKKEEQEKVNTKDDTETELNTEVLDKMSFTGLEKVHESGEFGGKPITDGQLLEDIKKEMEKRYSEVNDILTPLSGINALQAKLIESEWKENGHQVAIINFAERSEENALGYGSYKNDRYIGLVKSAIKKTILLAELNGLENATVSEINEKLGGKQEALARIAFLKKEIKRNVFWDPKLPWKALIDKKTSQQEREEEEKKAKEELDNERIEEARQLREQLLKTGKAPQDLGNQDYMEAYYTKEALYMRKIFDEKEFEGLEPFQKQENRHFYLGLSEMEKRQLKIRITLHNIRVKRHHVPSPEGFFQEMQESLKDLTKADLNALTNHGRAAEALSLYVALITGEKDVLVLASQKGITKDIFSLKTEEEWKDFRGQITNFIRDTYEISQEEAGIAERIAKNLVDISNLIECEDRSGAIGLTRVANSNMWDLINIREKTAAGGRKGAPWPKTVVGDWAVHQNKERIRRGKDPLTAEDIDFVPAQLTKDFFRSSDVAQPGGAKASLLEVLKKEGLAILSDADGKSSENYSVPWDSLSGDNPFWPYYLLKILRAGLIFKLYETGDIKSWEDGQKAFTQLGYEGSDTSLADSGLNNPNFKLLLVQLVLKTKEKILDPKRKELLYNPDTVWNAFTGADMSYRGAIDAFKRDHPTFLN